MHRTINDSKSTKIKPKTKDETNPKKKDDRSSRIDALSTPRNYTPKSSTTDIYAQKKSSTQIGAPKKSLTLIEAPKKNGSTTSNNISPMKNYLHSTSSTNFAAKTVKPATPAKKSLEKVPKLSQKSSTTNVTVNTPPTYRKLIREPSKTSLKSTKEFLTTPSKRKELLVKKTASNDTVERQRQNTRTLDDDEVKVLNEGVDNAAEMKKLTQKLTAKPKVFYVDLEKEKPKKPTPTPAREPSPDISYEDDFESYASDFDSYHSSVTEEPNVTEPRLSVTEPEVSVTEDGASENEAGNELEMEKEIQDGGKKDEERMLDSGNFDLHEARRSANALSSHSKMADITECFEGDDGKKTSLDDEGFQEMSHSSNVGSKTDGFTGSPFNFEMTNSLKRRRSRALKLKQRAKDLQCMITLHEMSYTLFEMQPIPYDLYMATFGRKNCSQNSTQTFDDGNTIEIQTEDVYCYDKWTQNPVEYSTKNICYNFNNKRMNSANRKEDLLTKFNFLHNTEIDNKEKGKINEEYLKNPLRIYLEQHQGVGNDEILPIKQYENKLNDVVINKDRLRKFLKKSERRICSILNSNTGNTENTNLLKPTNIPDSKGYTLLYDTNQPDFKFLNQRKIENVLFSRTKSNFLFTIFHKEGSQSCIACLWDISVASSKPLKILTSIDNIAKSVFSGDGEGIFIAALDDNSVHLWDLSEEPTVFSDARKDKSTEMVEIDDQNMTATERDREWNRRNRERDTGFGIPTLRASSYTTSASSMLSGDGCDCIVGLEYIDQCRSEDGGRRVLGQASVLQRNGTLTLWSVLQEKNSTERDPGKAYWSKIKLKKVQVLKLNDYIEKEQKSIFDLSAAKRRLAVKRRNDSKFEFSNPSAILKMKTDRPFSARSKNATVLPSEWENVIICTDLKIMEINRDILYLASKNNGEVLICNRMAGTVKVDRFYVTDPTVTITCLQTNSLELPIFVAGADNGTIHLCSVIERRVLLTLDNRNIPSPPPPAPSERCISDHKGRFISTVPVKPGTGTVVGDYYNQLCTIKSLEWWSSSPWVVRCADATWHLPRGDLTPAPGVVATCSCNNMATWTDNEVQIHRLVDDNTEENIAIFKKYISLL